MRVFGLATILMRSGLELDLGALLRIGWAAIRLTVLPGVSEADLCSCVRVLERVVEAPDSVYAQPLLRPCCCTPGNPCIAKSVST